MTKKGSGYLSLHAMRPIRSPFWRRGIGKALRFIARFLMWFGGLPLALAQFLMKASGRLNGAAHDMEHR